MQNSAISFSFCIDFRESKVTKLIEKLQRNFEVYYNTGLTLITVKNYDQATSDKYRNLHRYPARTILSLHTTGVRETDVNPECIQFFHC